MAKRVGSDWPSCFRSALAFRLWFGLLLSVLISCGSPNQTMNQQSGPLVRIHVGPVDQQAVAVTLTVKVPDLSGVLKSTVGNFTAGPFDLLGAEFPMGTRGQASFQVDLFGPNNCLLSSGTAQVGIDGDGVFDVTLLLTTVPLCGNGAVLTVQVANVLGGQGIVTSQPIGISCDGLGNGCSLIVMKGSQITLTPNELSGTFTGWSGGNCSGTSKCVVTVSQDVTVQAIFSLCRGWCKETLPSAPTTNFQAVGGIAPSNVLIAGDNGVIFAWDGATWKTVTSPAGSKSLRAVTAKATGTAAYVAGDGGTLLKWSGGSMTQMTSNTTANLRALAIGKGAGSVFAVGDGGTTLVIPTSGSVTNGNLIATGINLLSICQAPSSTGADLLVGGSLTAAPSHGFAAQWDGANSTTAQMASGMNILGNINAMLCGFSTYHYAAGDSGAMVRRSIGGVNHNNWTTVSSPAGTNAIRAMWASGDNYIIAVGDGGLIMQSDGTTWVKFSSGVTTNLRAIWGTSPVNIYAVGDNGTVLHYSP